MNGESPSEAELTRIAYDAELTLLRMESYEGLALDYDSRTDVAERLALAKTYREVVGVHPQVRNEFREALGRIREYGQISEAVTHS